MNEDIDDLGDETYECNLRVDTAPFNVNSRGGCLFEGRGTWGGVRMETIIKYSNLTRFEHDYKSRFGSVVFSLLKSENVLILDIAYTSTIMTLREEVIILLVIIADLANISEQNPEDS